MPRRAAALVTALETDDRHGRGRETESRRPHVPAAESPGVCARRSTTCSALDVDAGNWLPLDTKSANFDNIADAQALSPTLLEAYLNAAAAISRMAVGDRNAPRRRHDLHQSGLRLAASVGPRRRRAVRHARRHGRGARVPGRRRVRVRGRRSIVRRRTPVRRHRHLDRRRARGAARVRAGPAGGADGRGGRAHPDRAGPRARRPAARRGGVRARVRRPVRRSHSPARLVVRRRRFGRPRHHDAAARAGPDHQRAVRSRPVCRRRRAASRSSPAGRRAR